MLDEQLIASFKEGTQEEWDPGDEDRPTLKHLEDDIEQAVEDLYESAWEAFDQQVERWVENGDAHNYSGPSWVSSTRLYVDEVVSRVHARRKSTSQNN